MSSTLAQTREEPAPLASPSVEKSVFSSSLTGREVYEVLLAEIAGARGELGLAIELYTALARRTEDLRLIRRASEIALYGRDGETASELAKLWLDLEPASQEAKQLLTHALTGEAGSIDEVRLHLARTLAFSREGLGANLLGLGRALSQIEDKGTALELVYWLTEPYRDQPEAHIARTQAQLEAGFDQDALAASADALALRPDWDLAIMIHAEVLRRSSPKAAIDVLSDAVTRFPAHRDMRLALARLLAAERDYEKARTLFQGLLDESPENTEWRFAVALLSIELRDYTRAIDGLETLLDLEYARSDVIRFYLGEAHEALGESAKAITWFLRVGHGTPHYLQAQIRAARLWVKMGHIDSALTHIDGLQADPTTRLRLQMLKVQLLREEGRHQAAFEEVRLLLASRPDDPELLYEAAMIAERVKDHGQMEGWLLRLIQLQPDHAHAHNALGYSLADRNIELDRASHLIDKALELAPDDPFIIDSKAWVLYRQGHLNDALILLEKAWALRQDPEIGAHLGELYWALGQYAKAREAWEAAKALEPDNRTLLETVNRLDP
jgi:tetratricopeptide (TPR) repeat protein